MARTFFALFFLLSFSCFSVQAGDGALNEHLKPLEPYVGKTWRGEFKGEGKASIDISKWERVLNGQAVRITHSLNEGEYGGETLIYYDNEQKAIAYFYLTTAGFYTQGTVTFENGKFISHEKVKGNANGITEVKAEATLREDGSMESKSQYLKNGEWVEGHSAVYKETKDQQPVFK